MDDEFQSKQRPLKDFRVGSVTAAIWKSGDKGYSVTLQKSYKDDDGVWQNTPFMFHGDVACALRALDRAERWLGAQP